MELPDTPDHFAWWKRNRSHDKSLWEWSADAPNQERDQWWQQFNRECAARGLHHSDYNQYNVVEPFFKQGHTPQTAAHLLEDILSSQRLPK